MQPALRKQLLWLAAISFATVAVVLTWRWAATHRHGASASASSASASVSRTSHASLEVVVLDVQPHLAPASHGDPPREAAASSGASADRRDASAGKGRDRDQSRDQDRDQSRDQDKDPGKRRPSTRGPKAGAHESSSRPTPPPLESNPYVYK